MSMTYYPLPESQDGWGRLGVQPHAVYLYQPVDAGFAADQTAGIAPLRVAFTDQSSGDISVWRWQFGVEAGNTSRRSVTP